MSLFGRPKGKKYHTRTIEVSTYEYDDQRFAIEGCLTDRRFQKYHMETGGWRQPGILHHMKVYWLINKKSLIIKDLHVEMPVVPGEQCNKVIGFISPVKGLRISDGFTSKVKDLLGGSKGCVHILELLIEMSFSTIQGLVAYKQQGALTSKEDIIKLAENSCWPWRSEGPYIKLLKQTE